MKKNYFPHDYSARNDVKLIRLRQRMGYEGIGLYWALIEYLYENDNKCYIADIDAIADNLHTEMAKINQVINDFNLFIVTDDLFYSHRISDTLDKVKEIGDKRRNAINKRWNTADTIELQTDTSVIQTDTNEIQTDTNINININKISSLDKSNNDNNITWSLNKFNNQESNFEKSDVGEIENVEKEEQINYDSIVDFFNNETKGVFGKIRSPLSAVRKRHIKARIREYGKQAFADVIHNAFNSDFLKGQNSRNFRASFDWLILPTNFEKVLSGNYNTNTQSYGNTSNFSNNNTNTPEWLKRCQDTMQRLAQSANTPNNTPNV